MANLDDLERTLVTAKDCTNDEAISLKQRLSAHNVPELRAISKRLSIKLSGVVRKADIVERLVCMAQLGCVRRDEADGEDLSGLSYVTPEVKEKLRGLPSFLSVASWTKTLEGVIADFTFMNLLIYLVFGRDKTFDMQSMRAFKSLKAYRFFADGFVSNVWLHDCGTDSPRVVYVRGFVQHSLSTDLPLETFVALDGDSGDVYSAQCNCVSGLGQACNHVAAVLFYLEHHCSQGMKSLPSDLSKTSMPMQWNQAPRKVVQPAAVKDMKFVKASHGVRNESLAEAVAPEPDFDPRDPADRVLNKDAKDTLLRSLKFGHHPSGLEQFWVPSQHPITASTETDTASSQIQSTEERLWKEVIFWHDHAEKVVPSLFVSPTDDEIQQFICGMALDNDIVADIEKSTRKQADSKLWLALHNGRITSSRFGEILCRKDTTDPSVLVKSLMGYKGKIVCTAAMKWGKDNEDRARQMYIKDRADSGEIMSVRETGLTLCPSMPYLGASADGFITCHSVDTCCCGVLEIKCPYSIHGNYVMELSPQEIAEKYGDKFCLAKGSDNQLHLKTSHPYYAQIQGEMAIINVEWCDFVVFSGDKIFVDRIWFDLDYWSELLLPKLQTFYVHVAREILSGRHFLECYH